MCECTPKTPGQYCGKPGCRDPRDVEIERLQGICVAAHDRLLRGDDDNVLLALLAEAWTPGENPDGWQSTVLHVIAELEALDDETAQAQVATLRQLLGVA